MYRQIVSWLRWALLDAPETTAMSMVRALLPTIAGGFTVVCVLWAVITTSWVCGLWIVASTLCAAIWLTTFWAEA